MSTAEMIEQQAAEWLLRRESPDWSEVEAAQLQSWLDRSLAHKAAYWRLECAWRATDRLAALGGNGRPSEPSSESAPPAAVQPRRWQPLAVAASLLLLIGLGATLLLLGLPAGPRSGPEVRYATEIGGRRSIELADGSRVELNTTTHVRTRLSADRREIWLDRGEAYFDVAHIPARPFVVHAGPRTITVLGTKFTVRRAGDRVTIGVIEGRVRIEQVPGDQDVARSAVIATGDLAVVEGSATLVAANSAPRIENSLAWRGGMLSFDQTTLADAAAEFNRYNRRRIVIDDPRTASVRIGGTFDSGNVDAFVRLLHDAYGLRVEREGEVTRIGD